MLHLFHVFIAAFILLVFSSCHNKGQKIAPSKTPTLELFELENPPLWGTTSTGDNILAGGFSGLFYVGKTAQGELQFITHCDRGPNGEPEKLPHSAFSARPFLSPAFQPRIVRIETQSKSKTFRIVQEVLLTDPKGKPLSGLPQWFDPRQPHSDEQGVDLAGKLLQSNEMGIDPEGLVMMPDGSFWMSEEYRPSLLKFSASGQLLKRFIPKNSLPQNVIKKINKKYGRRIIIDNLPEAYKMRKSNRGFEGLAFSGGQLYAIAQSPLEIPSAVNKNIVRIVQFDPQTESMTGEFLYPLRNKGIDKIGDLASDQQSATLYAIEQNSSTGQSGIHLITRFALDPMWHHTGVVPEMMPWLQLQSQVVVPETTMSLADIGYDFAEKVEGLAVISPEMLAVINDNDFGVTVNTSDKTQKISVNQNKKSVLGIISWSH